MNNSIRIYRAKHGMTLSAFAAMVGVQKAAVYKWQRGIGPSIDLARTIEEKTGCEIRKEELRPDIWEPTQEASP